MKVTLGQPMRQRDGTWVMPMLSRADLGAVWDELHEKELDCTLKVHREKRSLSANAYAWVLIDKLAEKLNVTKSEIYCAAIKEIGGVSVKVCVPDKAVEKFCENWHRNGTGWMTEVEPSKLDKCSTVTAYYGSSTYDTAQMSRLIDIVVEECKGQGIETMTPAELQAIKDRWGEA